MTSPTQSVAPESHPDEKYSDERQVLTTQLRLYLPTADADRGLGTSHASLEPAGLYYWRLAECLSVESELRLWVPLSDSQYLGDAYDGPVLRYGIGFGYDLLSGYNACCEPHRLTAVVEFVGWTVLDGQAFSFESPPGQVLDVSGDTIVNVKTGFRWTSGRHSWYAGLGTALTNEVWYDQIIRVDYRFSF